MSLIKKHLQSIQNWMGLLPWQKVNHLEINDCFRATGESGRRRRAFGFQEPVFMLDTWCTVCERCAGDAVHLCVEVARYYTFSLSTPKLK